MSWVIVLCMFVSLAHAQSDYLCPPNPAMGLCSNVSKPCYSDSGCPNGLICCPHACSRICKPKSSPSATGPSIPDLLHHPRVFVGKCADSSCFSLFGGEPNECDTSNLCPAQKFCCNDGCRNICKWKPEIEALLRQERAVRWKKYQEVMQRRMLEERQKRMQVQARIAAEAEIARANARKQAELEAIRRQAEMEAARKQAELQAARRLAAMQENARKQAEMMNSVNQMNPSQSMLPPVAPQPPVPPQPPVAPQPPQQNAPSFLDNFSGIASNNLSGPSSNPSSSSISGYNTNSVSTSLGNNNNNNVYSRPTNNAVPTPSLGQTPPQNFFNAKKSQTSGGTMSNQINSYAGRNPYSKLSQQSIGYKGGNVNSNAYRFNTPANQPTRYVPTANQVARISYPRRTASNQMRNYRQSQSRSDPMESLLMYQFLQTTA